MVRDLSCLPLLPALLSVDERCQSQGVSTNVYDYRDHPAKRINAP